MTLEYVSVYIGSLWFLIFETIPTAGAIINQRPHLSKVSCVEGICPRRSFYWESNSKSPGLPTREAYQGLTEHPDPRSLIRD